MTKISSIGTTATAVSGGYLFEGESEAGGSEKVPARLIGAAFGTVFPTSPATGDRFYRTDRKIEYFFDGTRWLSTQTFTLPLGLVISSWAVGTTTDNTHSAVNPFSGKYDIYVEEAVFEYYLGATSNWTFAIQKQALSATQTVLVSTTCTVATTHTVNRETVNAVVTSDVRMFTSKLTKNSGTGNIFPNCALLYRIVG